jgi:hypothetical protein
MFTHAEMPYVIYPLAYGNPFYNGFASVAVELIVIMLSVYSCILWLRVKHFKSRGQNI